MELGRTIELGSAKDLDIDTSVAVGLDLVGKGLQRLGLDHIAQPQRRRLRHGAGHHHASRQRDAPAKAFDRDRALVLAAAFLDEIWRGLEQGAEAFQPQRALWVQRGTGLFSAGRR